jgi:hypothetical protein
MPAGSAASARHDVPRDFAAWFQRQLWHWNSADGAPMTLVGGKMGSSANSERLSLEYSCLDEGFHSAHDWVCSAFRTRAPDETTAPARSVTTTATWRTLMASLAHGTHFDEPATSYAAGLQPAEALRLLRRQYDTASAVLTNDGIELTPPRRPWRPEIEAPRSAASTTPAAPGVEASPGPGPQGVRRTFIALSLPGLRTDAGRLALAVFACLSYGAIPAMLAAEAVEPPAKGRFQLMPYWDRSFIVCDLTWPGEAFRAAAAPLRRLLEHPTRLQWLAHRATPYHIRVILDDARERVRETAARLLYGTELLETLCQTTDWNAVVHDAPELEVAVALP